MGNHQIMIYCNKINSWWSSCQDYCWEIIKIGVWWYQHKNIFNIDIIYYKYWLTPLFFNKYSGFLCVDKYYLNIMQEDYKILPKRNGRSDGSFQKMPVVSYFTNFYEIGLRTQTKKIYQYDIKLESDIPQDS